MMGVFFEEYSPKERFEVRYRTKKGHNIILRYSAQDIKLVIREIYELDVEDKILDRDEVGDVGHRVIEKFARAKGLQARI